MKRTYWQLPLLAAVALFSSKRASATAFDWLAGGAVTFDDNGTVTLTGNGKCFGGLTTSGCGVAMPTGNLTWLGGKAVHSNGNLYFSNPVTQGGALPAVTAPYIKWGNSQELLTDGSFYTTGYCKNSTNGASNTQYEPAKWNTSAVQPYNNCYNAGNDRITGTFAQPGRASGHMYTSVTCSGVDTAATWDGLVNIGSSFPGNNYQCANHGHVVFMAVIPGEGDYHWWRLDQATGRWSHKPGNGTDRDVDSSGNKICNPSTANRGSYTIPCYYYCTLGGIANIN